MLSSPQHHLGAFVMDDEHGDDDLMAALLDALAAKEAALRKAAVMSKALQDDMLNPDTANQEEPK